MEIREVVTPEELLRRADAIKSMAASEPFKWLIDAARRECYREWEVAKTPGESEAARAHLTGVQSIEKQVQKIIDAGVRVAHELEQQAKKRAKE